MRVGVFVLVGTGVKVGVIVGVDVFVEVDVEVGEGLVVKVGVIEAVGVLVLVGRGVRVGVRVAVKVGVGVFEFNRLAARSGKEQARNTRMDNRKIVRSAMSGWLPRNNDIDSYYTGEIVEGKW